MYDEEYTLTQEAACAEFEQKLIRTVQGNG